MFFIRKYDKMWPIIISLIKQELFKDEIPGEKNCKI